MIIHTRWKMYLDFLERYGDDYEMVFVADTRDVIFQGDIFAAFNGCKNWLGFATEADDIRGSKTGYQLNYEWFESCFGKAQADKIADQKIICCGTVIGSVAEMKIFCHIMWEILKAETVLGHEQALMNYLVYNDLLPIENLIEIDVDHGEIFTAFMYILQKPIYFRDDKIFRGDDGIPEVVHQYDRIEEFVLLVDEFYRDRNFSFDARFTDPRSLLEQSVCLLYSDKPVEATRLFLKVFFAVTDFGKYIDTLIQIWTIALRQDFSPTVETLEVAVQNSLLPTPLYSDDQLTKIQRLFVRTAKNGHAVEAEFKDDFTNRLRYSVENHLATGNSEAYSTCKKMLDELNAAMSGNFRST